MEGGTKDRQTVRTRVGHGVHVSQPLGPLIPSLSSGPGGHRGSLGQTRARRGNSPLTDGLDISGEKGRLAFEKMDRLCSEQREAAFGQEADVEITIF